MLLRARVENVDDPLNIGRIKVRIYGFHDELPVEDLPWAEPCFPLGGDKNYGIFSVPKIGSTVWVSFEVDDKLQPDPNCPVWIGTWYGAGENPSEASKDEKVVIKTKNGHKIVISDKSGEEGILIQDKNGNKIEIKTDSDQLNINVNQSLNIKSSTKTEEFNTGSLNMSTWTISGDITLDGNLICTRNITASGTVLAQSGLQTMAGGQKMLVDEMMNTFNTHTHTDSAGGTTSAPNQQVVGG